MSDDVIVTRKDIIAIRYCSNGSRGFCKRHGISWSDFLEHGVSSKVLEATGDAMALKAVEQARRRVNGWK